MHSPSELEEGRRLREALAEADIAALRYEWGNAPAHGILVLERVDKEAVAFLQRASQGGSGRTLVITTAAARSQPSQVWELLDAGASDVVAWNGGAAFLRDVAARFERWAAVDDLLQSTVVRENLVGRSRAWLRVLRQVVEIARFTSAPVLITGESGTGKELVARLVHTLDARPRKGELIVLDCTTVVPELSGSEFFGHERGAFTGAVAARQGAFALANGGTLFLDEVSELTPPLQAELLRVVQERTYKPVGGNTWRKTDFRLISATNRELVAEKSRGSFRADLYYRLASWTCHLPPLSERVEDIPLLAAHFVRQACANGEPPPLSEEVGEYLTNRPYQGNIRELRQLVFRMVYRHVGHGPISVGDIPDDERPAGDGRERPWQNEEFERVIRRAVAMRASLRDIGRAAEDMAVRMAVKEENGNWSGAADRLSVTKRALQLRRAAWRKVDYDGPRDE